LKLKEGQDKWRALISGNGGFLVKPLKAKRFSDTRRSYNGSVSDAQSRKAM
jgi:hypothetical protein